MTGADGESADSYDTAGAALLHSPAEAAERQQTRLRNDEVPGAGALPAGAEQHVPNTVYLVGVGPGDVGLLTVKALQLMQSADLLLYDRLVSPEILQLAGPRTQMLYVGKHGKMGKEAELRQKEIHELLLRFASSGKKVVRIKGGDPLVFGRGGEEMEFLERHGMRVEIVPGITSAVGVAAGLGVPLTHRDLASSVRFVTGHRRWDCTEPGGARDAFMQLADPQTTLVIYMGLQTLPEISSGLIEGGLSPDTPAVAVQDGTTPTQRVVAAHLGKLAVAVEEAKLRSPSIILVGAVVSLMDTDAAGASDAVSSIVASSEKLASAKMLACFQPAS